MKRELDHADLLYIYMHIFLYACIHLHDYRLVHSITCIQKHMNEYRTKLQKHIYKYTHIQIYIHSHIFISTQKCTSSIYITISNLIQLLRVVIPP